MSVSLKMETLIESKTEYLLNEVKEVKTLDGGFPVYEQADISLKIFHPKDVYPSALYVLTDHLEKLIELDSEVLSTHGIGIFGLDGIYDHSGGIIAPPVVEMSDGVPTIVDGIHRFYLAFLQNRPVKTIFVQNVQLPLISYPVGWGDVKVYESKPEHPQLLRRLRHGIPDDPTKLRVYYRDLSLLGSKGRRPRSGQTS